MRNYLLFGFVLFSILIHSQEKNNYDIGILLDIRTTELEPLLTQLKNQITQVVGEDAIISFSDENILSNSYSLETARANYQQLLNNDTDLILAFGVINNMMLSEIGAFAKPTILFGAVNRDLRALDESKDTSGIPNFTFLIDSQSFGDDLVAFKELSGFEHVGIAVEAPIIDVLPIKETLDAHANNLGFSYELLPFRTEQDIISGLNDKIDGLYLAGGFLLSDSAINSLANALIEMKIPSFTNTSTQDVALGIMATNQTNEAFNIFARRIALTVESFVNGSDLSDLPIYLQAERTLTVNYNTAINIGVPIKYSLIAKTNFVGETSDDLTRTNYNLYDLMQKVIAENLNLESSRKDIELSKQDIKTAKSDYYPDLTANVNGLYIDPDLAEISNGQNPEFSTDGDITLSQVLFSEGANANISIQKSLLKAEEENYNTNVLDAIFDISTVYFNALMLKTNVRIQKQNLDLTKSNLQIATQNYEAGESGRSDVLRFTSEMAQNTQSLIEAANQLEQTYIVLNQLINNPTDFKIGVEEAQLGEGIFDKYNYIQLRDLIDDPKLRIPFIEFLQEKAKANAPELKSLDYNLNAIERNIKLNGYGRFLPTLALLGQYNRNFNQWGKGSSPEPVLNDNYNIGLNLSLPIFNQYQSNINRQTAFIQKDQLEINKDNLSLNIDANINSAVLNLINEISNIETSKISEQAAKESLELTQTAYASGAVTVIELLDSQNNYLSAQLSQANAIYNYLLNSIELERYIGYYFLLNTPEKNLEFIQEFNTFLENNN